MGNIDEEKMEQIIQESIRRVVFEDRSPKRVPSRKLISEIVGREIARAVKGENYDRDVLEEAVPWSDKGRALRALYQSISKARDEAVAMGLDDGLLGGLGGLLKKIDITKLETSCAGQLSLALDCLKSYAPFLFGANTIFHSAPDAGSTPITEDSVQLLLRRINYVRDVPLADRRAELSEETIASINRHLNLAKAAAILGLGKLGHIKETLPLIADVANLPPEVVEKLKNMDDMTLATAVKNIMGDTSNMTIDGFYNFLVNGKWKDWLFGLLYPGKSPGQKYPGKTRYYHGKSPKSTANITGEN